MLRKPACHLSPAPVRPHLCSSLVYGTSTQAKLGRRPRLCTGRVLRLPGRGDPANATECLGSSEPPRTLPGGLPTLPSNLASWAAWCLQHHRKELSLQMLSFSSITQSSSNAELCPRHKAAPARQKFAEWSEPETQGKAVLLGTDWLGRAPQKAAEAEV